VADGGTWTRVVRELAVAAARAIAGPARRRTPPGTAPGRPSASTGGGTAYPGDHVGRVRTSYTPHPDGLADPGEVVWTWVPYEEDHTRGKDRPVLVVGRDGDWLLGLMLSSRDHDRDAAAQARYGRRWADLGPGAWDAQGRPSEVRLDRVVRVDPAAVRREGARLDRAAFDRVVAELSR